MELLATIGPWQLIFLTLVWILPSLFVGLIGRRRKIGMWPAFFISLFLSPFIGLIVVIISKKRDNKTDEFALDN